MRGIVSRPPPPPPQICFFSFDEFRRRWARARAPSLLTLTPLSPLLSFLLTDGLFPSLPNPKQPHSLTLWLPSSSPRSISLRPRLQPRFLQMWAKKWPLGCSAWLLLSKTGPIFISSMSFVVIHSFSPLCLIKYFFCCLVL